MIAERRFFCQCISEKLEALGVRKCDPVAAALTKVAFDLEGGPGPATVCGRRRMRRNDNFKIGLPRRKIG
jgi:hypothetical protein